MTDDLLNAYRREAKEDAITIRDLRAEVERLTAERDQARKDAIDLRRLLDGAAEVDWFERWNHDDPLAERVRQYEADERAKGGGRG